MRNIAWILFLTQKNSRVQGLALELISSFKFFSRNKIKDCILVPKYRYMQCQLIFVSTITDLSTTHLSKLKG